MRRKSHHGQNQSKRTGNVELAASGQKESFQRASCLKAPLFLPLSAMFVAEEACSCNQEQQHSRKSSVKDVGSIRERFRDRYCKIKEHPPSILRSFSTKKMHSSESNSSLSSLYLSQ